MTFPSQHERELMQAYLGGYIAEGALTVIGLDDAVALLRPVLPAATIDGIIVSRILRRLGFNRSYAAADAGAITYRKEVP